MKLLVASDIHGSAYYCGKLLERIEEEKPDRILLLGDILYHGPRNDLPRDYAPKQVIAMLNPLKDKLMCVRGNCDGKVDQMVLDFPILADYILVSSGGALIYATHGDTYTEDNPLPCAKGGIMLCGHTHVPKITKYDNYVYMNSGSVSIPKENSAHSYMIIEDEKFTWRNVEDGEGTGLQYTWNTVY